MVLRWPDGWTIEDAIAWTIQADEAAVLHILNADLTTAPGDLATLISRLKAKRSGAEPNGLKDDRIAHETIANALSRRAACRNRAALILQSLSRVRPGRLSDHRSQKELRGRRRSGRHGSLQPARRRNVPRDHVPSPDMGHCRWASDPFEEGRDRQRGSRSGPPYECRVGRTLEDHRGSIRGAHSIVVSQYSLYRGCAAITASKSRPFRT